MGMCPDMSADTNGDGVVSTTEGAPHYGGIVTTLSAKGDTSPAAGTDVTLAPSGSAYTYKRTITLDSKSVEALKNGTAVIVVHGSTPRRVPRPRARRRATWCLPCRWQRRRRHCAASSPGRK